MKFSLSMIAAATLMAAPAFAEGDPAKGERVFNQCQTCHVVANEAGEVLAGRNAKTGPNLYGVVGRTAGTYPDFEYGESIVAAGAGGLVWDEAQIVTYLADPSAFLKEVTGDSSARSMMAFKLRKEEDAANVVAYIASLAPATEGAAEPAATEEAPANP
jgi:cytochrome c